METMRVFSYAEATQYEPKQFAQRVQLLYEAKQSLIRKLVFLSHSSKDDKLIAGIIAFFQTFNANVYVDDFDKRLPNPPDIKTAVILKDEIKKCPRLVVLATPNSYGSRWIPWELGLADGFRGIPPNAVFPASPEGDFQTWLKTEYYNLYPKIVNLDGKWKVIDPRGSNSWGLSDWLHTPIK